MCPLVSYHHRRRRPSPQRGWAWSKGGIDRGNNQFGSQIRGLICIPVSNTREVLLPRVFKNRVVATYGTSMVGVFSVPNTSWMSVLTFKRHLKGTLSNYTVFSGPPPAPYKAPNTRLEEVVGDDGLEPPTSTV